MQTRSTSSRTLAYLQADMLIYSRWFQERIKKRARYWIGVPWNPSQDFGNCMIISMKESNSKNLQTWWGKKALNSRLSEAHSDQLLICNKRDLIAQIRSRVWLTCTRSWLHSFINICIQHAMMGKLKPGWLHKMMIENDAFYDTIPQWRKDMVKKDPN